jgi:hypothetical protein
MGETCQTQKLQARKPLLLPKLLQVGMAISRLYIFLGEWRNRTNEKFLSFQNNLHAVTNIIYQASKKAIALLLPKLLQVRMENSPVICIPWGMEELDNENF